MYDIEDVAKAGREAKTCPYYGSRYSIPTAEVIALPYNILFQKETRQSFSINLKGQVVIIDEAHNLIDTISQIHSVEINDLHVTQSLTQLNNYVNKYKTRFSAKNMLYLRQLLNVLNGLNKIFTTKSEDSKFEIDNGKLSLSMIKFFLLVRFIFFSKGILIFRDEQNLDCERVFGSYEIFQSQFCQAFEVLR